METALTVLVTGANGMLAQDLCPMLEDAGFEVIETGKDELDITNEMQVHKVISEVNPDFVLHCAAYTNVDKAEEEPETTELINAKGAEYTAKACKSNNAVMVYISTDYVFDGTKNTPYEHNDKTNPSTVYGMSKLHGEQYVQKYCPQSYIVRTSWLYGHHGRNFVETMISLAEKPEIKVVDDQIGCPTWTVDLSDTIISLIDEKQPFGIYHACGAGQTSWYGFSKEIFRLMNLNVNLKPCTTEEFPRPAKRPKYSVLANQCGMRDWKEALKEYIELRVD